MKIIPGNTRIENAELDGQELLFKREDANPSGSFKDRLIAYLWPQLGQLAESEIVLSSSGNLAISLLTWQAEEPLQKKITIFVKPNLPEVKNAKLLDLVAKTGANLVESRRPKSDCFKYARDNKAFWLRNSAGEDYPQAYKLLGDEILEQQAEFGFNAVFVCASSGTALQGILESFVAKRASLPVFAVQTSHVHPLAKEFESVGYEADTQANAISDKVMPRKLKLLNLLSQVGGQAIAPDNNEIAEALRSLQGFLPGSEFTGNAALSLAGFLKLQKKGYNFAKPLIIISGN
jgi:threonine synthase